jgi:hypothetical protein
MGDVKPILILSDRTPNSFTQLCDECAVPYQILARTDDIHLASISIENFTSLVIIANAYPVVETLSTVVVDLWSKFRDSHKPCFCEYFPVPGFCSNRLKRLPYQRLIVLSTKSDLTRDIPITGLLECHQVQILTSQIHHSPGLKMILAFGKVVGTQTAIYGLPKVLTLGLGQIDNTLIASFPLSNWQKLEFRPVTFWYHLWIHILKFLFPPLLNNVLQTYLCAHLPYPIFIQRLKAISTANRTQIYRTTMIRGLKWFETAKVLVGGMGSSGVYEGFSSGFDDTGQKLFRKNNFTGVLIQRADCTADVGIAFICGARVPGLEPQDANQFQIIGNNLFNVLYHQWQYFDNSICRGFFGWGNTSFDMGVFYADDNGRDTLLALWNAVLNPIPEVIERAMAAVMALYSTHGKNGHRYARLELREMIIRMGRPWFRKNRPKEYLYHSPHYEGWTFAALLYGAYILHDSEIINLITQGIEDYMKRFPNMRLEHSVNDDYSKLLIATVILYQCTKNTQHLEWVQKILDFFGSIQDPNTGAIPERDPFRRRDRREKRNQSYGTGEASVYSSNTDTITDQLYSMSFLSLGFYLAYKTGQFPCAEGMLLKALDFLSAIQIESPNPQLHGAWMRGFDYRLGEYGGSNGDQGWGVYSIETGWMVGPILLTFALWLQDWDVWAPLPQEVLNCFIQAYNREKIIQTSLEKKIRAIPPTVSMFPKKNS